MIFRIAISVCLLLFSLGFAKAQMDTLKISATADFEINGKADNVQWSQTEWVTIPMRLPSKLDYKTKVKILYSESGIYFNFWCEDKVISSTMTEDFANLYEEDVVEVFFWPDESYPFYFEYELSPNNFELPIFVPNVEGDFMGWRPWKYEGDRKVKHTTSIEKEGGNVIAWTAEFYIPFALLKPMSNVPPKPGTLWRANMYRLDYDNDNTRWTWQAIVKNFHDYKLFGYFLFD